MNILVLIQIFETPSDNGSDRNYFFCKKLVEEGFNTNVITSNIDYKSAIPRYPSEDSSFVKDLKGITIEYLNVYTNIRGSFIRRVIFYLSFFFKALFLLINKKQVDVVYAISTPLSTGFLGVLASKLCKAPLVFEVTDVWPDAAVHSGVLKNRILINIIRFFEILCYRHSSKIIALTEGIKRNIQEKITDKKKVILIPNGVDEALFSSASEKTRYKVREQYGFNSKIVAMYLGAHGRYNSLETIIESAILLKEEPKFLFVFIGDGDEKDKLIQLSEESNLKNTLFLDPLPHA
ncbi:MAG: hypothetical protein CMI90_07050 [Pelagibacteraceae bacterium]|nr:hypothetical protein [Pelagibacteraceae bacterium]